MDSKSISNSAGARHVHFDILSSFHEGVLRSLQWGCHHPRSIILSYHDTRQLYPHSLIIRLHRFIPCIDYLKDLVSTSPEKHEPLISSTLSFLLNTLQVQPDIIDMYTLLGLQSLLLTLLVHGSASSSIRTNVCLILSIICKKCIDHKGAFRDGGGVEAMINILQSTSQNRSTTGSYSEGNALLASIECIWTCIVGDSKSEASFLLNDGVSSLLNLLHSRDQRVAPPVIACLSDLLRNQRGHGFFFSWVSPVTNEGGLPLLLGLWRLEEVKLHVPKEEDGTVKDVFDPLGSATKEESIGEESLNTKASDRLRQALLAAKTIHNESKFSLSLSCSSALLNFTYSFIYSQINMYSLMQSKVLICEGRFIH
jgi:hypothetical protein